MSWTTENEYSWQTKRRILEDQFNSLLGHYKQVVTGDPTNITQHNALEAQMTSLREELSQLGYVLKDALEELRIKTGTLEEPAKRLEKELERITTEENMLKHRKETRKEQTASLEGRRGLDQGHTIGFLMMKPLAYPLYTGIAAAILWLFAAGVILGYSRQFASSAGITSVSTNNGQGFTRQNYRTRIG